MNPASQFGSMVNDPVTEGLGTGITLGKFRRSAEDKPLFIEALILKILVRPSAVRCSFLFISSIIDLNRIKSGLF